MMSRTNSTLLFLAGVCVLAFALPTARTFWGAPVAFFFLQNAHGVLAVVLLELMANLIAALPFGLLYGYIVTRHAARSAALFATVAVTLVVLFEVWIGVHSQYWWGALLDAISYIVLFSFFAALAKRFITPPRAHGRTIAATTFVLLGMFCYFSPLVYFTYVHVLSGRGDR